MVRYQGGRGRKTGRFSCRAQRRERAVAARKTRCRLLQRAVKHELLPVAVSRSHVVSFLTSLSVTSTMPSGSVIFSKFEAVNVSRPTVTAGASALIAHDRAQFIRTISRIQLRAIRHYRGTIREEWFCNPIRRLHQVPMPGRCNCSRTSSGQRSQHEVSSVQAGDS